MICFITERFRLASSALSDIAGYPHHQLSQTLCRLRRSANVELPAAVKADMHMSTKASAFMHLLTFPDRAAVGAAAANLTARQSTAALMAAGAIRHERRGQPARLPQRISKFLFRPTTVIAVKEPAVSEAELFVERPSLW
jgi:hypothetical protein